MILLFRPDGEVRMSGWRCVLELDGLRRTVSGSSARLRDSLRQGADLRIGTVFRHNEHIDVRSTDTQPVEEVAEFGVTYQIDSRWSAGIMSLRQPIELPDGFGVRPSMSFFLYNEDGTQAIARPYLDGKGVAVPSGPAPATSPPEMPKYHVLDNWDQGTTAPSQNFVYDFDSYRFFVNDVWHEVLHHTGDGRVVTGSLQELHEAFQSGRELKVGVSSLCDDLAGTGQSLIPHEVFIQAGSVYYYTERRLLMAGTHPLIRVCPSIPLRYSSSNWDFGWLMLRTDGHTVYRRCDPYTLRFSDHRMQCAIRWFVR